MRGRLVEVIEELGFGGNTPAYAGKTPQHAGLQGARWKHPRVCGEDLAGNRVITDAQRNTPAYAGKTAGHDSWTSTDEKHPRVCGEDSPEALRALSPAETPPRMRGRLMQPHIARKSLGNTPAYAGKTLPHRHISPSGRKHPRVCGEDASASATRLSRSETPPRMRGRRSINHSCPHKSRNTPAYAGETA